VLCVVSLDHVVDCLPLSLSLSLSVSMCQGPNTGGMGAYAPAPLATPALMDTIMRTILKPTVDGLRRDGKRERERERVCVCVWACVCVLYRERDLRSL
jgi:hypothetical protein